MRQQSRNHKTSRVIRLSTAVYRWLLLAYPASFRREYGEAMTQVFRDSCRDAWRNGRPFAMLELWVRTLIDLAKTAVSERMKMDTRIPLTGFIRVAGIAGAIAGGWNTLLLLAVIKVSSSTSNSMILGSPSTAWLGSGVIAMTLPLTWLLFTLALLGLHVYLAQRSDSLRLQLLVGAAAVVTCFGALLAFVSVPILLQGTTSPLPVIVYASDYFYGTYLRLAGYEVLGVGLLGTGWASVRTRALGSLSWLPLVCGVLFTVGSIVGPAHLPRPIWVPYLSLIVIGLQITICVLWNAGWVALGIRLWTHVQRSSPHKPAVSTTP